MPYTEKQRRFLFSELKRKKSGKKGRTDMSVMKLEEMAHSPLEKEARRGR